MQATCESLSLDWTNTILYFVDLAGRDIVQLASAIKMSSYKVVKGEYRICCFLDFLKIILLGSLHYLEKKLFSFLAFSCKELWVELLEKASFSFTAMLNGDIKLSIL